MTFHIESYFTFTNQNYYNINWTPMDVDSKHGSNRPCNHSFYQKPGNHYMKPKQTVIE